MAFNRFNIVSENEFEKKYIYLEDDDILHAINLIERTSATLVFHLRNQIQDPISNHNLEFLIKTIDALLSSNNLDFYQDQSSNIISFHSGHEHSEFSINMAALKKLKTALEKVIRPRK